MILWLYLVELMAICDNFCRENNPVIYDDFGGRIGGYFDEICGKIAYLFMLLLVEELSPTCDVFVGK